MSERPRPRCTFEVFTLFPAAIEGFVGAGLLGKALEGGRVRVHCTDFRAFTRDRHRTVDDAPFGGGAGMVLKPGPVVEAMEHVVAQRGPFHRVLLTPSAPRLDQRAVARLAAQPRIGLLCGRYEGIDDRVREGFVDECLSLGDFVLGGGEVAALVVIEAVARLVEGVVGNPASVDEDSFGREGGQALLEHPHYTRPAEFRGRAVPSVLLGGDHAAIARWRRQAALGRTWALRPELRTPRRLPEGHPVYLAVPAAAQPDAAVLAELARAHAVTGLLVLGAEDAAQPAWLRATGGKVPIALVEQPRALRRRLRRAHRAEPHIIGLAGLEQAAGDVARVDRRDALLDLLAGGDSDLVGALVVWVSTTPPPPGLSIHAIYARDDLTREHDGASDQGLAIPDAIAQSSRPFPPMLALAHAALTRLRDRG